MAAAAILPELATQVLIPVAAAVGIAFAVVQWVLVSKVRLTPERRADGGAAKSGPSDYLIEEEEGLNDHNVVVKCAEIQNAISEGEKPSVLALCLADCIYSRAFSLYSSFEVGTRGVCWMLRLRSYPCLSWMLLEMIETLRVLCLLA
jgi:hypothetical protein